MVANGVFVCAILLLGSCVVLAQNGYTGTALDDYVALDDGCYGFNLLSSVSVSGGTVYTLNMTSLCWQNASFSNHYVWYHTLEIAVPTTVVYKDRAILYINGGSNSNSTSSDGGSIQQYLSSAYGTGIVSAVLYQIPNQPMTFASYVITPPGTTNSGLTEDQILARTFRLFMDSDQTDPTILALFPMVKAAVRSLDTIQNFTKNATTGVDIEKFFITGASKRGWTTWLTAGVDKRVFAIAPLVAPLLNMPDMVNEVFDDYGNFGYALEPYTDNNVWDFQGTPQYTTLFSHVDPVSYLARFNALPKLVVDASLDRFFIPDCPRNFWSSLDGPKFLALQPNTDHEMTTPTNRLVTVVTDIVALFHSLSQSAPLPTVSWTLQYSKDASVTTPGISLSSSGGTIASATLWTAHTNPGVRDFRYMTCPSVEPECFTGVQWVQSAIPFNAQGIDTANVTLALSNITNNSSTQIWTGFFIEVTYTLAGSTPFVVTSEVNIYPDFYPFGPFAPNYTAIGYTPPPTTTTTTTSTTTTSGTTTTTTGATNSSTTSPTPSPTLPPSPSPTSTTTSTTQQPSSASTIVPSTVVLFILFISFLQNFN